MAALPDEVANYPHGRVPREVRERQILAVAARLFEEHGYEDASIDELCRRAGVSKPVIYDLVGNKATLFRRCFESAAEELRGEVVAAVVAAPVGDLASQLHAGALAFFRWVGGHPQAGSVLFTAGTSGRLAAGLDGVRRRQVELVASVLSEHAARAGGTPDALRLESAAVALAGAFEALARWGADRPDVTPERLADELVAFALPGLRAGVIGN